MPNSASWLLEIVVATEDAVEHRVDSDVPWRDTGQRLALAHRHAEIFVHREELGVDLVQ